MDSLSACGVKVMLTELDLNVLPNPDRFGGAEVSQNFAYREKLDPYRNGITKEGTRKFEQRYLEIFKIINRHRDQISRVTFWGVDDGTSWLNGFPVPGRTNYPLFFDRQYKAKPIMKKVIDLFK
jgi:endo-1,4-beta-xylanase